MLPDGMIYLVEIRYFGGFRLVHSEAEGVAFIHHDVVFTLNNVVIHQLHYGFGVGVGFSLDLFPLAWIKLELVRNLSQHVLVIFALVQIVEVLCCVLLSLEIVVLVERFELLLLDLALRSYWDGGDAHDWVLSIFLVIHIIWARALNQVHLVVNLVFFNVEGEDGLLFGCLLRVHRSNIDIGLIVTLNKRAISLDILVVTHVID